MTERQGAPEAARDPGEDARELLGLVDRLGALLDDNDLAEIEVEADGTRVLLRRLGRRTDQEWVTPTPGGAMIAPSAPPPTGEEAPAEVAPGPAAEAVPATVAVVSPLTGIFYASPAPGSAPYVQAGGEVAIGQVIGLVEAMKLFNEIKSHVAGRVVRLVAEPGALVKAKQALIEVDPL